MTFPKNLFHATELPIIVRTEQEEEQAKRRGFGDAYIPQQYPKVLYHDTHTAEHPVTKVVQDPDENDALGAGWHEAPPDPKAVPQPEAVDTTALVDENRRLQAELDELRKNPPATTKGGKKKPDDESDGEKKKPGDKSE